jgi:tetratricopeptide (TPR) repeat protein
MKKTIFYLLVVVLCCVAGVIAGDYFRPTPDSYNVRFVGRDSCVQCHEPQAAAFHGSHHDKAMEIANDETVLGNFDNQSLEHFGVTSRMFRDGDRFMINTEGPDGVNHDYEIKYTFGYEPLQQYMVELDQPDELQDGEIGKLQVLRVSWDTNAKKWFYLTPPDAAEKLDPTDPLHWTGSTQNWNLTCATCHSTNFKKNFDLESGSYHSTFSEIDVSCEACHGPASYHVQLANRNSLFWDRKHGYGLASLKTKNNLPQIESCAPCHSRRSEIIEGFVSGCNFDEYYALQTVTEPIYHTDGQIRDEDYVIGSFTQSKMFHNGVKCSDCHDVHSTKLIHSGNLVCTSCHQHPSGKYDTPNHHHHAPGTPGSNCVDCHMPQTTYMTVDKRRDHSFRVPDPSLSLETGTPNACTSCHIDSTKLAGHKPSIPLLQYRDWIEAAERGDQTVANELDRLDKAMKLAVDSWYSKTSDVERTTYYRRLARGIKEQQENAIKANSDPNQNPKTDGEPNRTKSPKPANDSTLVQLAKDSSAPNIIRASAIDAMDGTSKRFDQSAFDLASHQDVKIVDSIASYFGRRIAAVINTPDSNFSQIKFDVEPLVQASLSQLNHRSKRIRIAAARTANSVPPAILAEFVDGQKQTALNQAITELEETLNLDNDRAMVHAIQGSINEQIAARLNWKNSNRTGQSEDPNARKERDRHLRISENNYRDAIRVDPNVTGPRANLAALLEAKTRMAASEKIRNALVAEIDKLRTEEHNLLKIDIRRAESIPGTHALHYRFAMSCYLQNDLSNTEKHLKIAVGQQPKEVSYLAALAAYYLHVKKRDEASTVVDQLLEIDPNNKGFQQMKLQSQQ